MTRPLVNYTINRKEVIHIKKLFAVFLCAVMALCLAGCGNSDTIDSLLSAPSLTKEQSSVLKALSSAHSGHTSFVYPTTGTNRSAIRQLDIDNDGEEEAVAFFRDTESGINAHMAILEPDGRGNYYISSELEGPGNGVASFSMIKGGPSNSILLVEWSSQSISFNSFAAYTYKSEELELGMEENCTDLILSDIDLDGIQEFLYTTRASDDGFLIKAVKLADDSLNTIASHRLVKNISGIKNVVEGILQDGTKAIFVDELTNTGLQTEVFVFSDGVINSAAFNRGYDIPSLTQRADSDYLLSRRHSDIMCIPSSVPPSADIAAQPNLMYWYTFSEGNVVLAETAFVSTVYGISMGLPDSWAASCTIRDKEGETYAVTIYDPDNNELVTLTVLNVNDDAAPYTDEGFTLIGNSASNRFFCRFECTEEETDYIKTHFSILRLGEY